MFGKILAGLGCAFCTVVFAVGALGLAIGAGPVVLTGAYLVIGACGMFGFSCLMGE